MALPKTSSFAENRGTLLRSSRQEENALQKKLSLMRSMCRQFEAKLTLEGRAITKRLRHNLERSVQTDRRITITKQSMVSTSRRHYKIRESGTAMILNDTWAGDNSNERASALCCNVTIPAALSLLRENGLEIEENVLQKLEDMKITQAQFAKSSSRKEKKEIKSNDTADSNTFALTENIARVVEFSTSIDTSHPQRSVLPAENHFTPPAMFDDEIDDPISCRMRSNTAQFSVADLRPNMSRDMKKRPISAPDFYFSLDQENDKKSSESPNKPGSDPPDVAIEQSAAEISCAVGSDSSISDSDDMGLYFAKEPTCPLQNLHAKVHERLEEVTLVDLHRALIAAKDYPGRMKLLARQLKKMDSAQ